ncbi:MAG: hypothetical protein QM762_13820 [Chryseolinea sp.]
MRAEHFDMRFTTYNGHDGREIEHPSWTQIEDAIRKIDSETNCFAILTTNTGDYLQCAGGQTAVTLEFRQIEEGGFKHFVLGKGQATSAIGAVWSKIDCKIGPIWIHKEEELTLDEAVMAFRYFFDNSDINNDFKKRNITKLLDR